MRDDNVIRVVQFKEGPWYVAQCLDIDIAAQGKTESDLLYQLSRVLVGRVLAAEELGVKPFAALPPAPRRYWEMYFAADSQPARILPYIPTQSDAESGLSMPTLEIKAAA